MRVARLSGWHEQSTDGAAVSASSIVDGITDAEARASTLRLVPRS
jgi:hypothetical protein